MFRTIRSQGQDLAPHPTQSRTQCSRMSFSGRAPAPWSALWPAACARLESLSWCWRWRPAGCLVEKGRIQLLHAYVDGHVVHGLGVRAVEHRLGTHDMVLFVLRQRMPAVSVGSGLVRRHRVAIHPHLMLTQGLPAHSLRLRWGAGREEIEPDGRPACGGVVRKVVRVPQRDNDGLTSMQRRFDGKHAHG